MALNQPSYDQLPEQAKKYWTPKTREEYLETFCQPPELIEIVLFGKTYEIII